jgi:hypothetical protein
MSLFEQTASRIKQDKHIILRLNAKELRAIFDADTQELVRVFGPEADMIRTTCHCQEVVLTSEDEATIAMMKRLVSTTLQ